MDRVLFDEGGSWRLLRLSLEEICCELCRFHHVEMDRLKPEEVRIDREVDLGSNGFADLRVRPKGQSAYFVEVAYGQAHEVVLGNVARKYGPESPGAADAAKLVLVFGPTPRTGWKDVVAQVKQSLHSSLALEVWDKEELVARIERCFGVAIDNPTRDNLPEIGDKIDQAKWQHAFGGDYATSRLRESLLWHFGYWRLRQLHEAMECGPQEILPPGRYRAVVVVMADLCSFSSYVRDTPSEEITRAELTKFYSCARYAIINHGGMLDKFVGDSAIGCFGIPDLQDGYVQAAYDCARALMDIGNSVSRGWQQQIDRAQPAYGVHIGIGMGDMAFVSLRGFSRAHMGAIGDTMNVAARLQSAAGPGEIVVANTFFQQLHDRAQAQFVALEPIEARNVGLINAWALRTQHDRT